jgi:hypothetical protein
VPEVFLWSRDADYDPDDPATYPPGLGGGSYVINDADHCWHEFGGLAATSSEATDGRTLLQFGREVEEVSAWHLFKPLPTSPSVMARLVTNDDLRYLPDEELDSADIKLRGYE